MSDLSNEHRPADAAPAWRQVAAICLVGIGLCIYVAQTVAFPITRLKAVMPALRPIAMVGGIAILLLIPAIHRTLAAALDRIRHPSAANRRLIALAIWPVAIAYLAFTAAHQHRDFAFKTQDEFMYLIQVQAVAHGRLWMPQHPMADFFQEFYIFVRPVTSGMYFPGMAIMFAPAIWLHVPLAVWALLICGAVVAMTYRVTTELIDSVAGLLAVLLMLGLTLFRTVSLETLSYMPMALLGLLMFWAWLHWRRERRKTWVVVLGALAGWAAITRPLDAIAYFLPICIVTPIDWMRSEHRRKFEIPTTLLIIALAAAPFLAMQFAIDKAVTGHYFKTPIQRYQELFWPGTIGGLHPHLAKGEFHPATPLPQFEANYNDFVKPHFRRERRPADPFILTMRYSLPHYLLFPLLAVSVLGLSTRPRAATWSILLLFPVLYLAWVMFISWYALVIAPVVAFATVLGAHVLAETFPRQRAFLSSWLAIAIAVLIVVYLPELKGKPDKPSASDTMTAFNRAAAMTIQKPALVFFRYHPEVHALWKAEQAYNVEAASFDDEPIVRAHDLGLRDIELVNYYNQLHQNRMVYLFDQATAKLTPLGSVGELAGQGDLLQFCMGPIEKIVAATKPAPPRKRRTR